MGIDPNRHGPLPTMSTSPPSAAAVLEYTCLFTHDLRRKQKRWQDGRLKYHAFNKRVMVYDERGNFVGDMHWRHDFALDEGEEIELERGGVIVQVSSLVSREETDLSELLDKRVKEKEQRHLQKLARSPAPTAVLPQPGPRPLGMPPDHFQLRHRPLHQVIGTPTGHHGKALVPKESPFERRQDAAAAATETLDERAAKRRKHEDPPPSKSGYSTALFGQSLTLSATPASSVPMKRRARPEPDPDPSGQVDHPTAREVLDTVPRGNLRMARQLNQKSGYAQGLFGQSLTLSHTPVSSVLPRRQPRHESSSGSTDDTDGSERHENPQPALREQSKVSRHFDQPASRPQKAGLEKKASANRKSLATRNHLAEDRKLKDNRVISLDRGVEVLKHATSEDDDVVEIDDPGPVQVQLVQQPRREEDTRNTGMVGKQTLDCSTVTTPRQKPTSGQSTHGRPVEQEDEQSNLEKREEPARPKRTKPAATKPATHKRTADLGAPRPREDPTRSIATSRRADEHVTELKLKSRKRGLLMISDAPKKPRRQAVSISTRPSDETESLDANARDRECDDAELGKDARRTRAQRTISTELGEFNGLSRSPSPEPKETSICYGEAPSKHSGDKRERPMADLLSKPDKDHRDDDDVVFGEDLIIDQATTQTPPPPNEVWDPYRLPSSPEEEVPIPRPASKPGSKSPPTISDSRTGPADRIRDAQKAGSKPNTASRTKQQRPPRRRVSLEDDEEPYELPTALETLVVSNTEDDTPATNEAAPTKRAKPKKTAEAKKRKSRTQDSMADLEVEVDESVEAIKIKTKKQHVQASPESQDEQAERRRRSTRQKRHRVDESDEPALASELDVSQEEEIPKKRQRGISKASDSRPRLERIKKNIKSRELIGFNLTALKAPLGPRGIGMPFSILSSPVDESIQKRMSNQAVMEASSDPVIKDGDETSIHLNNDATKYKPNRIVVDESSTAELSERPTTSTSTSPTAKTQVFEHTTTNEDLSRVVENAVEACPVQAQRETVTTGAKKQLAAQKSVPGITSGSSSRNATNDTSSRTPHGPLPNISTGLILLQGHHAVIELRANDCEKTKVQANAHILQATMDSDLAISTDNPSAAQKFNSTDRKQRSKPAVASSQEIKEAQVALDFTEITQTTEASVVAAATSLAPLEAPRIGLQRRPSTSKSANSEAEVHESKAGTTGSTGSNESSTTMAQVALAAPAQKPTPAIQQQPSTTIQEDGTKPEGAHDKPVPSEEIRVEQTAGPAIRPRVTAPFKKPTPAIRRQPSTITATNEIHTSLIGAEPDTTGDSQSNSAYASAATSTIDAPLRTPAHAPVSPSPNREDNTKGESDTSGENPETKTAAPAALIQRNNSIGLRRQTATSQRVNNIRGVRPQVRAPEDQTTDSATRAAVKIVNPASRGRKAALAADAVGQVPQRVLPPTQPPLLVPISTADLACTPYEPPPKEPERPKRKMKFPGFQSARGEGPWSREAFDLLESGRPS